MRSVSRHWSARVVRYSVQAIDDIDLKHLKATNNCFGCDLSEAELREANLSGADLREADLGEADLSGADLHEVNLSGVGSAQAPSSNNTFRYSETG